MSMRKKSRSKQGLSKTAKAVPSEKGAAGKNPIEVYPMREAVHRLEAALQATYKRLGLK